MMGTGARRRLQRAGQAENRQHKRTPYHPGALIVITAAAVIRQKEDAFASIWVVPRPVRPMGRTGFPYAKIPKGANTCTRRLQLT